jgi:hypothetical protein
MRFFSRWSVALLACVIGLACMGGVASAQPACSGCRGWWSLESSVRPVYLHTGARTSEVQEVETFSPSIFWLSAGHVPVGGPAAGEETWFMMEPWYSLFGGGAPHRVMANAAELQHALAALPSYGPATVVSERSGAFSRTTFTVTTPEPAPALELHTIISESGVEVAARVTQPGSGDGQIVVSAANLGDAPIEGVSQPLTLTDQLPKGVEAVGYLAGVGTTPTRGGASCQLPPQTPKPGEVVCSYSGSVRPFTEISVTLNVNVTPGAHPESEPNQVSVSGGGAASASLTREVAFADEPVPFGIERDTLTAEEPGGAADTQAGSHPFQVTGSVTLNQVLDGGTPLPAQMPKDLTGLLPAGLVGNPTPLPRCPTGKFLAHASGLVTVNECPPSSAVGVAIIRFNETETVGVTTLTVPIFNLEPEEGEPARFGFLLPLTEVYVDTSVRSGRDYGVSLASHNITEIVGLLGFKLVFWGVPGAPAHDSTRGNGCVGEGVGHEGFQCNSLEASSPSPFLSMPTSCQVNQASGQPEPLRNLMLADSWAEPKNVQMIEGEPTAPLDGCNRLPFTPEIKVEPNSHAAATASGINVDVHVPQAEALNANGLAPAEPRNITVALPAGVAVNPAGGDGLQACSEGLVGFEGFQALDPQSEPGVNTTIFKGHLPGSIAAIEAGETQPLEPGVNFCSNASKIGNVRIKTPLLPKELEGAVYLATQNQNPFGGLLALYMVAEEKQSGVLVKLAGNVALNPTTGQLTATFENSPQAPFEDATFEFFGGERAPLATPAHCGSYTTSARFTSWSSATPVAASSTFQVTEGPNGAPCPGASLPFSPSLTGGATNLNAGFFSPFTLTMNRKDGEQNIQSVQAHLPPGLSGVLSNIALCPEPQAGLGECPANSLIGEATVSVGVGSDPYTVSGGKFYLTGPYNGSGSCNTSEPGCAPFGITFEVPAKAGPFDLERNSANPAGEDPCDCVIVRGKIEINPYTAAITISSNPPGTPDAIPTSIEGIPLEIQHINATTTRGNFQFNPTNCNKMAVTGTIHSSENATDTIGVPFQVTNCAVLGFKPAFKVATSGKTSRANGASLTLKVTRLAGPGSGQANFASAKIDLPKQLPSRLTTLQKACPAKTFEANPAECSAASIVGHARVITPILPVPLEGPAYFVSHGGEAFPNLIVVLQGYGVKLDVVSDTFISKAGVTSGTLKLVPDAPFTSFELTLPEGKYSALAANGDLCKSTLKMPTAFTAQNGIEIHQSTPISVTGCPKHKAAKKKTKAKGKKKNKKK